MVQRFEEHRDIGRSRFGLGRLVIERPGGRPVTADDERTIIDAMLGAKALGQPSAPGPFLAGRLVIGARHDVVEAFEEETRLFINPGYAFRVVDVLLTNFHLPRSTLLMLVCAFGGMEAVLAAYRHAVEQGYRFFSYGDAMLIERFDATGTGMA